jgi:hypothetical protein
MNQASAGTGATWPRIKSIALRRAVSGAARNSSSRAQAGRRRFLAGRIEKFEQYAGKLILGLLERLQLLLVSFFDFVDAIADRQGTGLPFRNRRQNHTWVKVKNRSHPAIERVKEAFS